MPGIVPPMDGPSLLNPSAMTPQSPTTTPNDDALAQGLFFIVGTGRCGTTLLQAMLMSHPRLCIPPETRFFLAYDPALTVGDPVPEGRVDEYVRGCVEQWRFADLEIPGEELRSIVRAGDGSARAIFLGILRRWAQRQGKPRAGEKTPNHFKRVDRIGTLFPEARFIHLYRDPRDVALSMRERNWSPGPAALRRYARTWTKAMRRHLDYACRLGTERYLALKYEDLVENPEAELRRVCAFLGEAYDPAMLRHHERTERGYMAREEAWKSLADKPVSKSRVGRYRDTLTPRQIRLIERTAAPLMGAMGYAPTEGLRDRLGWRVGDACDWAWWRVSRLGRSVRKRLPGAGEVDEARTPRA